jgi:hypothetical protein
VEGGRDKFKRNSECMVSHEVLFSVKHLERMTNISQFRIYSMRPTSLSRLKNTLVIKKRHMHAVT